MRYIYKRYKLSALFTITLGLVLSALSSVTNANLLQPRIVGGNEAPPADWPFMTALLDRKEASLATRGESLDIRFFSGSSIQGFDGEIVDCEFGQRERGCDNAQGKVCLITGGQSTLPKEQVETCQAAGGSGVIITLNAEGNLLDFSLKDTEATLPAVFLRRSMDGDTLKNRLGENVTISLETPGFAFCGGTYIGGTWVVTAAHCVSDAESKKTTNPQEILLNVGGHDLTQDKTNLIDVVSVKIHPDFNFKDTFEGNDIALLELSTAPQDVAVTPIADIDLLNDAVDASENATILGFGTQTARAPGESVDDTKTSRLREANFPLTPQTLCNDAYNDFFELNEISSKRDVVKDTMLCAGAGDGTTDTCQGDSGGPLLIKIGDTYALAGITSIGLGCAQQGSYGIYTRVPVYIDTLRKTTGLSLTGDSESDINSDPVSKDGGGGVLNPGLLAIIGLIYGFLQKYSLTPRSQSKFKLKKRSKLRIALLMFGFLTGLTACASPPQGAGSDNKTRPLEPLISTHVNTTELNITVLSNGCTKSQDFDIYSENTDGHCKVSIPRLQPDYCKRSPFPITLHLSWNKEQVCGDKSVVIINPALKKK